MPKYSKTILKDVTSNPHWRTAFSVGEPDTSTSPPPCQDPITNIFFINHVLIVLNKHAAKRTENQRAYLKQ